MKNQKGVKKAKFEEKILNELNLILRQELSDTRLQFASLTKVELSNDFSEALVYWDTFDSSKKDDIAKAFKSAENNLRATLSQVLRVRHTPDIKLKYDTQYESEQYISEILGAEAKKLNDGDS